MDSALRAQTCHTQNRKIRLRLLTHNLAILWRPFDVLYRAGPSLLYLEVAVGVVRVGQLIDVIVRIETRGSVSLLHVQVQM